MKKTLEVNGMVRDDRDISWRELALMAAAFAGGTASLLLFQGLNPGWDRMGSWPAAAWMAGGAALACVAGFLSLVYRCYLKRRYGRLAPLAFAAFVLMHLAGALLVMGRVG